MPENRIKRIGLENVVMADTEISMIDGEAGTLIYRGYDIKDLAKDATYEEVAYLLMFGNLPTESELDEFKDDLVSQRELPEGITTSLSEVADQADPIDALRLGILYLSIFDDLPDENDREIHVRRGKSIMAKAPTILAYYDRMRRGLEPVAPREDLDHAENFLYMLDGERPDEIRARHFDSCLILPAEHGINASTFTARVVSSTLSDMYSAIVAAICAIKGPLHGGASGQTLGMLNEINSPEEAIEHVDNMLDDGQRIPGFGHRVYQTIDPRADVLRDIAEDLAQDSDNPELYETAVAIEDYMRSDIGFDTNLDYYSAVVYRYLNIPEDLPPLMFCQARIAGWVGHILEQYDDNRLIRPRAEYVGAKDLEFVPLSERE